MIPLVHHYPYLIALLPCVLPGLLGTSPSACTPVALTFTADINSLPLLVAVPHVLTSLRLLYWFHSHIFHENAWPSSL